MVKIVVQTGDIFDRPVIDSFLTAMPVRWEKLIDTIVVYGNPDDTLRIEYNGGKQVSIHSPHNYAGTQQEAIEELAIGLFAVEEMGHIPEKLSNSRRREYRAKWHDQADQ